MIRSFEVRAFSPVLAGSLASALDDKLVELQRTDWKIISVVDIRCKGWEPCSQSYFDTVAFAIIAEHK